MMIMVMVMVIMVVVIIIKPRMLITIMMMETSLTISHSATLISGPLLLLPAAPPWQWLPSTWLAN